MSATEQALVGAWSPPQKADPEIQHIANQVRGEVESKAGVTFTEYIAETFQSQVMAGMKYKIELKVKVVDTKLTKLHLQVHKDFDQHVSVSFYYLTS
uniref:Cystatin n=1 Tax=Suberites domuncula TaxID=55567 RepID=B1VB85_SUBDO|nr:cystatin [Suberites domuncula]